MINRVCIEISGLSAASHTYTIRSGPWTALRRLSANCVSPRVRRLTGGLVTRPKKIHLRNHAVSWSGMGLWVRTHPHTPCGIAQTHVHYHYLWYWTSLYVAQPVVLDVRTPQSSYADEVQHNERAFCLWSGGSFSRRVCCERRVSKSFRSLQRSRRPHVPL